MKNDPKIFTQEIILEDGRIITLETGKLANKLMAQLWLDG